MAGLRPPSEPDIAAGEPAADVAVVVGAVVVPGAEEEAVGEVGASALGPGVACVVGFAPGGGDVAALGAAAAVADRHGLALRGAEQTPGPTQVVATAASRHMHGRGVILVMGGGREAIRDLGGSHVAWAALAGLCRQLAAELGPRGVRVAWLLSPGSPDPDEPDPEADGLLLARRPSYAEVAKAAVFASSDWAAMMTATEINLTAGAVVD